MFNTLKKKAGAAILTILGIGVAYAAAPEKKTDYQIREETIADLVTKIDIGQQYYHGLYGEYLQVLSTSDVPDEYQPKATKWDSVLTDGQFTLSDFVNKNQLPSELDVQLQIHVYGHDSYSSIFQYATTTSFDTGSSTVEIWRKSFGFGPLGVTHDWKKI